MLKSKGLRELFFESAKKKKLNADQLKLNLIMIIEINNDATERSENDGLHYKHLDEPNMCIDERKSDLVKALKKARERRRIAAQKYKLSEYIDSPENFWRPSWRPSWISVIFSDSFILFSCCLSLSGNVYF